VSAPTPAFQAILRKFAAEAETICAEMRAEARREARREMATQLNQAVRRIRQASSREELADIVADTATPFASGAIWFRIDDGAVRSEKLNLTIPLTDGAALKQAADSREPVIALATGPEVSFPLADRLAHSAATRAFVYPIVSEDKTSALLYAWSDGAGEAPNSALEILAQVAAPAWEALKPPPEPLVEIAPAKPADPWDALSPEEQATHLRAQRFARVQVAELRLKKPAEIQSGRMRHDLYGTLRESIDAARDRFRKEFFAKCPSMVDYLHLELTRTLANDDADLLGKDYPGPMV
jgi:hypothetical protein